MRFSPSLKAPLIGPRPALALLALALIAGGIYGGRTSYVPREGHAESIRTSSVSRAQAWKEVQRWQVSAPAITHLTNLLGSPNSHVGHVALLSLQQQLDLLAMQSPAQQQPMIEHLLAQLAAAADQKALPLGAAEDLTLRLANWSFPDEAAAAKLMAEAAEVLQQAARNAQR